MIIPFLEQRIFMILGLTLQTGNVKVLHGLCHSLIVITAIPLYNIQAISDGSGVIVLDQFSVMRTNASGRLCASVILTAPLGQHRPQLMLIYTD